MSRIEHGEMQQLGLSQGTSDLYESLQASWHDDMDLAQLIHELEVDPNSHPSYS